MSSLQENKGSPQEPKSESEQINQSNGQIDPHYALGWVG